MLAMRMKFRHQRTELPDLPHCEVTVWYFSFAPLLERTVDWLGGVASYLTDKLSGSCWYGRLNNDIGLTRNVSEPAEPSFKLRGRRICAFTTACMQFQQIEPAGGR